MKRSANHLLLLAIGVSTVCSSQDGYYSAREYLTLRRAFLQAIDGRPPAGIYSSYKTFLSSTDLDPRVTNPKPNQTEAEFKETAPRAPSAIIRELPPHLNELYGKPPPTRNRNDIAGKANCWNTALVFNEPEREIKFTSSYEMVLSLGRNYRLARLPLEKGDIISIWTRTGDDFTLEHSAVFLKDTWTFGKQTSFAVGDPYQISTFGIQFVNYDTHMRAAINTNKTFGDRGVPARNYVYSVHRKAF